MARQSISLTQPNDEWLKKQIISKEFSSKSELINDLIRQARGQQHKIDWLRLKLEKGEQSGFTSNSREDILAKAKKGVR
ncbi:ribbon-helix-helix domain-containing protein [Tenacibaculum sp. C7A-26P2]|uniref:ribbon-helix-helix domain-containing protein n=1 Tax=Tenacibaculum sp. C7A-26P2 TaxID=3447504 RepID=UPI003F872F88